MNTSYNCSKLVIRVVKKFFEFLAKLKFEKKLNYD